MIVAAAVLAAGASERFGRSKQAAVVGGEPLVRRAAGAALDAGCAPVVIVVGAHAAATIASVVGLDVRIAMNPSWREGLSSSVRCALDFLTRAPERPVDAVVLLGCDQPAVDGAILERLVVARGPDPEDAAACRYAGVLGAPAVFGRAWLPQLASLSGDRGAAELLRQPGARVTEVPWPAGARDIDHPEDLPPA